MFLLLLRIWSPLLVCGMCIVHITKNLLKVVVTNFLANMYEISTIEVKKNRHWLII